MKKLNRKNIILEEQLPIKIVQFGEGNFLRAFVDYAFQQLNSGFDFNGGVTVVQPIEHGMFDLLEEQDGLYTLFLKGIQKGEVIDQKELITNIVKCINPYNEYQQYLDLAKEEHLEFVISNTTEAGISYDENDRPDFDPPNSFPAKLTLLLYERFKHFNGDRKKGLTIIPCELINYNADTLRGIILKYCSDWNLGSGFKEWILDCNSFHNTLVDRIVPGYPRNDIENYNKQLDYADQLIVTAEIFFLWVIEGGDELRAKLPFHKTGLNVKIVQDMQPYRTRKVRILNGAHTSMVPFSLLYGNETVRETVENKFTGAFVNKTIFEEINDTLSLEREELDSFTEEVLDRFRNPFVKHRLADIALNSISKFKVRVLPSLLEYQAKHQKLPTNLTFAFACLIRFYKGVWNGKDLPVNDSDDIVSNMADIWKSNDYKKVSKEVLKTEAYWGENLNHIPELSKAIALALKEIDTHGIEKGYQEFSNKY